MLAHSRLEQPAQGNKLVKSIRRTAILLGALICMAAAPPQNMAFKTQDSIQGPDGHWDFASWDDAHHDVLVAHGQDVLVVSPSSPARIRAIGHVAGAHTALAIPGTETILVSSGRDDSVLILDRGSGQELKRIAVAGDPDAVILSEDGRTAYAMAAKAGAISVIDIARGEEARRIQLQRGLEVPVLFGGHFIAVNNEDHNEIEIADLATGKAAGAISLEGCEGPTGLAMDPSTGLALSACANGKAALVNLADKKVVQLLAIGDGPDTAIWQAARHRFLVPCGRSGTVSVIALNDRHATTLPVVTTETSARTAALDPASGRLFLPAAHFNAAPQGQRPAIVPGSFHILVMAPAS
jgi:DNA-binding beta-propeller fold protein YncE